jgi:hypothetical protein
MIYDLDREKSTDRLLVFVKSEEVGHPQGCSSFVEWSN